MGPDTHRPVRSGQRPWPRCGIANGRSWLCHADQPFHNYDNSKEYSDGYTKGVDQRRQETSYRGDYGTRGGSRSYVNFSDLANREATYTWGQLEQRGFALANDRRLSSGEFQALYWNASTRQCVETLARDTGSAMLARPAQAPAESRLLERARLADRGQLRRRIVGAGAVHHDRHRDFAHGAPARAGRAADV